MKKTVRLASLLLALALVVSTFAACGDNSSSTASKGGDSKSSNASTDVSESSTAEGGNDLDTSKEVELVMYVVLSLIHIYVVSDRPAKQDEIDENFHKIFKEKLNCTLKVNWIGWAEYQMCIRDRVYAVIDLHAAAGAQSCLPCDDGPDNAPHLFLDEESAERTIVLCEEIARRLAGRWIVGAYD